MLMLIKQAKLNVNDKYDNITMYFINKFLDLVV